MQIREQHLAFAQARALNGLRLLDLDDHLRLGKHLIGGRRDRRTRRNVVRVGEANARTGLGFHQYLVALQHEFLDRGGHHADAVFVVFDFLGYTDPHG